MRKEAQSAATAAAGVHQIITNLRMGIARKFYFYGEGEMCSAGHLCLFILTPCKMSQIEMITIKYVPIAPI